MPASPTATQPFRDWDAEAVPLERILEMSARALALDPDLAEAHASRGLALHQCGQDEAAIAAFRRRWRSSPISSSRISTMPAFLYMHGNFEEAVRFFKRAADIRPDDFVAPIHLMSSYKSLGRTIEKETWARLGLLRSERALNQNPANSGPAHRGALALAHMGDGARARDWAARAIAIDPHDTVAQYNIACVYAVLGDIDEAIDLLERLLPIAPPIISNGSRTIPTWITPAATRASSACSRRQATASRWTAAAISDTHW